MMVSSIKESATPVKMRAVIADDEPAARRFLRQHLSRAVSEVDVVGEARSGRELLSVLDGTEPEILLLDIMMPGLTGLEALKTIREHHKELKVLIVSAYDRFEFAREALSLGAIEFLLKPVRPAQLEAAVRRCVRDITEERARQQSYETLRHRADAAEGIARASVLRDLITGSAGLCDLTSWNHLELIEVETLRSMIVVDIAPAGLPAPDQSARESGSAGPPRSETAGVATAMSRWADAHGAVWCMPAQGRIVVLPRTGEASSPGSLAEIARDLRAHLSLSLSGEEKKPVTVAFVGPVSCGESVDKQYRAACQALNRAYVTGQQLVRAAMESATVEPDSGSVFALEARLAVEVKSGSPSAALALLRDLIEQVAVRSAPGGEFLAVELVAVVSQACRVAGESAGDRSEMFELRNATVQKIVRSGTTLEMVAAAQECLKRIFESLSVNETSSQRLVSAAKAVVDSRASEDITLTDVASAVYVSPYYLSRLFKATGTSFQDYLTRVRITKAKSLLRDTDMPCSRVGREAGYSSASYFSHLFKRVTGLSPAQFREGARRATTSLSGSGPSQLASPASRPVESPGS